MRLIERIKARAGGYWWQKCPICSRGFGGHEVGWSIRRSIRKPNGVKHYICPRCTMRGEPLPADVVADLAAVTAAESRAANESMARDYTAWQERTDARP